MKKNKKLKDVKSILLDVKLDLTGDIRNITPSHIKDKCRLVVDEIGEDASELFNVKSFFRTLRKSSLYAGDKVNFINSYFDDYMQSLDIRSGMDLKKSKIDDFKDVSILDNSTYKREKSTLQVELLKLQEHVKDTGKKILIICEGRDAAGKGSFIKKFTEHLNPRGVRVETFGVPTEHEKEHWFERYENVMPVEGEIVLFDRSYYNRAVVEPVMDYCTKEQYEKFMLDVNPFESKLLGNGTIVFKLWFSITREKQKERFTNRLNNPLKYWKFSVNDIEITKKWDEITSYKDKMLIHTGTVACPWVVVDSNDKKMAQLNAMRYILGKVEYSTEKNDEVDRLYSEIIYEVKK